MKQFNLIRYYFLILGISMIACSKENPSPTDPEPEPPVISNKTIKMLYDDFQSQEIVVVGSEDWNFIVSFKRMLNNELLEFEVLNDQLPHILKSSDGTIWNWFGKAVEGPLVGNRLETTHSMMGYWFIFGTLYPGAEIFEGESRQEQRPNRDDAEWLIPTQQIAVALGFDAIQSIDDPQFIDYEEDIYPPSSFYLQAEDLVVGLAVDEEQRAYTHSVLDWHEIINDNVSGAPILLTYCPLTGTAMAWNRELSSGTTTFGVSGILYNSNLMPYDRSSESIWTQLDGRCVKGELKGTRLERHPIIETSWETWQTAYDTPVVLSENQGNFGLDYRVYPYGNYKENNLISFPIYLKDDRLPLKERVHAVLLNGVVRVYDFSHF